MTADTQIILFLLLAIVALAIISWLVARQRRSRALRERFGEEYERTLAANGGSRAKAEADLVARTNRAKAIEIRPLDPALRQNYIADWTDTKAMFVDDPVGAIAKADRLLADMMEQRGYPMGDFHARHGDLTVQEGEVAKHYLAGHEIADRATRNEATTEELRRALQHYDRLFTELLDENAPFRAS
ncbi:hypothetical protein [Qipengyuania sediminis]|uniref:hypothetical protein n=1 Tax=Qipengyuania sediminis TaxID=1532023 RepID=UPI00105A614B|nr:hypothetical protein [Qipengyuania sediminis]